MKRRDFLIKSAGVAGALVPGFVRAQTPCPPPNLTLEGGTPVNTNCAASSSAEADWQSRISGAGVVWYHDFRSDAEVNAFRWTSGYMCGNDPLSRGSGATNVRRITTDGVTGACLEILHPAGSEDTMLWWRPFSPLTAPGNGKTTNDPAANGTVPVRKWNATDGGNQTASFQNGYYAHPSNTGPEVDGNEFYLQMRVKRDPRRISGGNQNNTVGKFTFLTVCRVSLSDQELVTYSGAPSGSTNNFRMYGGWQVFQALDQAPGTDGTIQPGGVTPIWSWALNNTWDTIMYHLKPGRPGVNETLIEVYGAHAGQTSFTLFWQQTFAVGNYNPGPGWQALICTVYNNGFNFPQPFFDRWCQIIFSKQFIPCPQV